jgi:SAM-dependent methyltransferase
MRDEARTSPDVARRREGEARVPRRGGVGPSEAVRIGPLYDDIGKTYTASRAADPRLAARIVDALGDARSIANVGAGAGAYEPCDRDVIAIEPSGVMVAQRPPGSAPVLRGSAEALPLADDSVDAAMAVMSDHHWRDRRRGLREMRRIARHRVVLVNSDPTRADAFWLTREYLPGFKDLIPAPYREQGVWARELRAVLGPIDVVVLPVPHDCRDGFYQAFWRRPEAYLRPAVRDNISVFGRLPLDQLAAALQRLTTDLETGAWAKHHGALMSLDAADVGLRLVIADVSRRRR